MALVQHHTKKVYGEELAFENAYHKISRINATINEISISVEIFRDATKENLIDFSSHKFNSNEFMGADLIQIGYALLKTLPEYEGAINVFEEGQPVRELMSL